MGNDAKRKADQQRQANINLTSRMISNTQQPSPLEGEMANFGQGINTNYNNAVKQNTGDYTGMMGKYNDLYGKLASRTPTKFTATRPGELTEAYGNLRSAGKGYQDFADTGGYSGQDIQELRARGISPIRAAYGNATRELDRSRSLSGGGSNYIAAASKMQRELPGQLADATTNVNAGLADAIRQGKLAGLGGLSGVGSSMGSLSSEEANRILTAQGMTEDSYQRGVGNQLNTLGGMNSLYGTTPGMSSMFGSQALNSFGQRAGAEGNRNNLGLNLIQQQMQQLNDPAYQNQVKPWWQKALGVAGKVAPYAAMMFGGPAAANSGKALFSNSQAPW